MNTQRITISLPEHLYDHLKNNLPSRKISRYISQIIEEKIIAHKTSPKTVDPIEILKEIRAKYPIKASTKQILESIRKGRT